MGPTKEEQKNRYRISGAASCMVQSDTKKIVKPKNPVFIKKALKLLPIDKDSKRISFYDSIRFGKYQGKTGREVLQVNKRYLKYMQADTTVLFCPIMIARLKN